MSRLWKAVCLSVCLLGGLAAARQTSYQQQVGPGQLHKAPPFLRYNVSNPTSTISKGTTALVFGYTFLLFKARVSHSSSRFSVLLGRTTAAQGAQRKLCSPRPHTLSTAFHVFWLWENLLPLRSVTGSRAPPSFLTLLSKQEQFRFFHARPD